MQLYDLQVKRDGQWLILFRDMSEKSASAMVKFFAGGFGKYEDARVVPVFAHDFQSIAKADDFFNHDLHSPQGL